MADEKKDRWKTALVEAAAAQGKPRVEVRKRLMDIENRTDPSEEFPADTFRESSRSFSTGTPTPRRTGSARTSAWSCLGPSNPSTPHFAFRPSGSGNLYP